MSELKPLLDGDLTDRARRLLETATRERAPRDDQRLAALSLAIVASHRARIALPWWRTRLVPLGGGLVCLVAWVGFTHFSSSPAMLHQADLRTRSVQVAAAEETPPEPRAIEVSELPLLRPAKRAAATADTMTDELMLIDEARSALVSGNAGEALGAVQRYLAAYARGTYREEAESIAVRALAALGRRDEAERGAATFLAAHPASPYARRVRAAVAPRAAEP